MHVELITIGEELLLGYTVDSNAAYLARALAEAGVEIVRHTTVGDDLAAVARVVGEALDRTGAVITTGGLGPTSDDMAKPAVARVFGREMQRDAEAERAVNAWLAKRGATMRPAHRQLTMMPEGARILRNQHGSAPGAWLEDDRGRWVAMLPGVPREMRAMTGDTLLPLLRDRVGANPPVVLSRTLRTTGIAESAITELLGEYATAAAGLPVASLPGWEGVDLRLTARGMRRERAEDVLERGVTALYERVERYVYGEDGTDLASVVLEGCRARAWHVATAESCTGGLLGARLTAIPGSSDVYTGGLVAYANAVKEQWVGVPAEMVLAEGAVSEPVARQLAAGVAARMKSEVGVGITGIAGPGGGTPEKPVGTVWIGVSVRGAVRTRGGVYAGDRAEIRQRSAQAALEMIWRAFQESE
ncbi:MAG TPA: competence/damage-inducible protein A [Gemmatimonadaceae bacterium]|nr:competence/damage-inducible protein A [Gemmatimonadaceae bacterium]